VLVHAFTDGRDTPPRSADGYLAGLAEVVAGKATLATVSGRYYAMDRDKRWERLERAWSAVVAGEGLAGADAPSDALAAVAAAYARGESDEFIQPTVLAAVAGQSPLVREGDAVIFWNFRADRARQMCAALSDPDFAAFDRRGIFHADLHLASMTRYEERQSWPGAFPPESYDDLLVDVWARHGLKQLRIAETEKYAHVTYFFSGGREEVLSREERILIPSPKVATYDHQPEMSVPAVTERLLAEIRDGRFDAIVLNFASPDMVGHTGVIPATVRAVEVVDDCVGRLVNEVTRRDGMVAITADHGNAEQMLDPVTGEPHTAHTTNPVPLLICGAPDGLRLAAPDGGADVARLADVAPTLLDLMGLPRPAAMTGRSLVQAP
jgi:2,3-bisphosphoglycerate-independent phosphoglycerate mutase